MHGSEVVGVSDKTVLFSKCDLGGATSERSRDKCTLPGFSST